MARDKIGAAERQAVAELRARAADASAAAAATLIADRHDAAADAAMADEVIAAI
jgi:F-type H+-transporting ATPase subunit b